MNCHTPSPVFRAVLAAALLPCHAASAGGPTWAPLGVIFHQTAVSTVAVDRRAPASMYAATVDTVYRSSDGGLAWQSRLHVPGQGSILDLAVDPFDTHHVLVATDHGLYASSDAGDHWQHLIRSSTSFQSANLLFLPHPSQKGFVFLGNDAELLISSDGGQHWRSVEGALPKSPIRQLAAYPAHEATVFALTDRGLFSSADAGHSWSAIRYPTQPTRDTHDPEDSPETALDDADEDRRLMSLAIDPEPPYAVYVATGRSLWRSIDEGANWQPVPSLGLTLDKRVLLHVHAPAVLYAATANGIARYLPQQARWESVPVGLPTAHVRRLASTPTAILAATDQGLYILNFNHEEASDDRPSPRLAILGDFAYEPSIEAVQDRAMKYAEVEPDKIRRWRRQLRLKALLPTLGITRARDDDTYVTSIGSTTNPAFDRIVTAKDPSSSLNFSLHWDLSDLLWNKDQLDIDNRSRLTTQLRDDILDDATRSYFERRRLQVELLHHPPQDPHAQLEKELRLQELTAMLDGLTGGWFSRQLRPQIHP